VKNLQNGLNDYRQLLGTDPFLTFFLTIPEMSETEGNKEEFISEATQVIDDIYNPAQELETQMLMYE
jgi:hypothetical protein